MSGVKFIWLLIPLMVRCVVVNAEENDHYNAIKSQLLKCGFINETVQKVMQNVKILEAELFIGNETLGNCTAFKFLL